MANINDVGWRYIDKDRSLFLEENRAHRIIAESLEQGIRDTCTHFIDPETLKLDFEENFVVWRYAYYI